MATRARILLKDAPCEAAAPTLGLCCIHCSLGHLRRAHVRFPSGLVISPVPAVELLADRLCYQEIFLVTANPIYDRIAWICKKFIK